MRIRLNATQTYVLGKLHELFPKGEIRQKVIKGINAEKVYTKGAISNALTFLVKNGAIKAENHGKYGGYIVIPFKRAEETLKVTVEHYIEVEGDTNAQIN
jgi:hypothetical protein